MEQILNDAQRLVQRVSINGESVEILTTDATNLEKNIHLTRTCKKSELNFIERRRQATVNRKSQHKLKIIQNLIDANGELSISSAEHQSAIEIIMARYRNAKRIDEPKDSITNDDESEDETKELSKMKERISEMTHMIKEYSETGDDSKTKTLELIKSLQEENERMRNFLDISNKRSDMRVEEKTPNSQERYYEGVVLKDELNEMRYLKVK